MKIAIVFALCVALLNTCYTTAEKDPQKAVSRSNWQFASSIYTKISQAANPEGSIIFSPVSVQAILALCSMGARGKTAKQILKGLDLADSTDDMKIGFKRLLQSLPSSGKANLEISNQIFPALQYHILKTFSDTAQEFFSSDVANVNYEDSKNAARTINELVKQKTRNKITDIVSEDGLDGNTAMVLVNAVYFKGLWDVAFDKEDTTLGMFYVNQNVKKEVMMMQCKRKFNFDINTKLGAKLLEVPYMNNTMIFVIILPLEDDGLPSVEARLASMEFKEVYESSKQFVDVHLKLPIFSMNQSLELKHILKELEIVDMFGSDADFSGMSPEMGFSVSKVLHTAMIEVNEEGTAVEVQPAAGLSPQSERFVVDHPFTFALVSKPTNVVVLMGRYTGDEGEARFTYDTHKSGNDIVANRKKIRSTASGDEDFAGRLHVDDQSIDTLKNRSVMCKKYSSIEDSEMRGGNFYCERYFKLKESCDYPDKKENREKCMIVSPRDSGQCQLLVSSWIMAVPLSTLF